MFLIIRSIFLRYNVSSLRVNDNDSVKESQILRVSCLLLCEASRDTQNCCRKLTKNFQENLNQINRQLSIV